MNDSQRYSSLKRNVRIAIEFSRLLLCDQVYMTLTNRHGNCYENRTITPIVKDIYQTIICSAKYHLHFHQRNSVIAESKSSGKLLPFVKTDTLRRTGKPIS